jgi:hypothetical protein
LIWHVAIVASASASSRLRVSEFAKTMRARIVLGSLSSTAPETGDDL